jgi:hypothetical protein
MLPKLCLTQSPIKIPIAFVTEIEKSTVEFICQHKRLWIDKAILSIYSKDWSITISYF